MQHTIYTFSVPLFIKLLTGLKGVLAKAEAHVKEKGLDEEAFLNDALYADMFPLKRQVQIAGDNAKGLVARLTGKENPKFEDTEKTFAELQERIDNTLEFVKSVQEKDFDGAEERQITLPYFPGKYMTGTGYAFEYAIPNFLFHVTTAYGIIRKNGVQVGKSDFMHTLPLLDLES